MRTFVVNEEAIINTGRPDDKEYNTLRWMSHQFNGSIFFDTGTLFGRSARALCDNPTNLVLTYDVRPPPNYGKHKDADISVLPNMLPKIGDCKKINLEWISKVDLIYLDICHTDGSHDEFVKRIEPHFKGILLMDCVGTPEGPVGSRYRRLNKFWNEWDKETHFLPELIAGPRGTGIVPYGDWTIEIRKAGCIKL
jgi:hypothetical protein